MRPATLADMPLLLEIGAKFTEAAEMPFKHKPESLEAALTNMIETGCVLVTERGAIGGVLGPAWANPEWVYACELFWWAEDGRGMELLRGFEKWAKEMGANEVRMTSLHRLERGGKVLTRAGYAPTEISYGRAI